MTPYREKFIKAALGYLRLGLSEFHGVNKDLRLSFQPAIGNLGIFIELTLKAFVAEFCIERLFTNIPLTLSIILSRPELMHANYNQQFDHDLHFSEYNTIEFGPAISIFNIIFPEKREEYKALFNLISDIRNLSVHSIIPNYQKYNLDRIAYLSIKLYYLIEEFEFNKEEPFILPHESVEFFNSFNVSKAEEVRKAINKAKGNSKKVFKHGYDFPFISQEDWTTLIINCPVCNRSAKLIGETEKIIDSSGKKKLIFTGEKFECPACGLAFNEYEEIKIANIKTSYDRSLMLDDWEEEFD